MNDRSIEVLGHEIASEFRVGLAQVMEIIPPLERVAKISRKIIEEAWAKGEPIIRRFAPWLLEHYESPARMHVETVLFLSRFGKIPREGYSGPGAKLIVYADPEPSSGGSERVGENAEKALGEGASGFKVISTVHLTWLDSPVIEAVFEVASSNSVPVLVHAGCDPGIWELPAFCSLGNPARLEDVIRRYRDVYVIIAHAGGYSAVAPGVYMKESVELARKYPNVYLDSSAVPFEVLEMLLHSLPPSKIIHASDYPVVEDDTPARSATRLVAALLARGADSRKLIEAVLYGNLEEVSGEKCREIPLSG
ncbi:MAG: hypothetical protein DSY37_03315 [Hyperthermus sp.]|nr:MAG: hypothetical protein DSY37_03315 [Hyperthermus sp.]